MFAALAAAIWLAAAPAVRADALGATAVPASPLAVSLTRLTGSGGRLSWYRGGTHDLIAFDAGTAPGRTELFTMRPDGSDRRCVTCDMVALPGGFLGQPAWHPDGEHLVIQAQGTHSRNSLFNHMAWGINNDLWLITRDGTRAEPIWRSPEHHGALHPHFDQSGGRLTFAERAATGRVVARRAADLGAGGENQWTGWRVVVSDVDLSARGEAVLSGPRRLFTDRAGFYETHGFAPNGALVFSHTADGRPFVDDIFAADPDGGPWTALVSSPATWDEHGKVSPSGRALAFASSRADAGWRAPRSRPDTLTTELFLRTPDGRIHQITQFNARSQQRILVSDFDWDREGRRIAVQVAPMTDDWRRPDPPQIWLVTFAEPK